MSLLKFLIEQDTNLFKKSRNEMAGPCPRNGCSQKDGFVYNSEKRDGKGAFMCRGCWDPKRPPIREDSPRWGDEIDFLMWFRGMSYQSAKATISDSGDSLIVPIKKASPVGTPRYGQPPLAHWQEKAMAYIEAAVSRLWSIDGVATLDYLLSRGLLERTIRSARLGSAEIKGVEYLIIPHLDKSACWKIQTRDMRPGIPSEERYKSLKDSVNTGLYLSDCLARKRVTVLVEGEIDALTIAQEASDLVNVVALSGKDGSCTAKWIAKLAIQPLVLIALDNDAQSEPKAEEWRKYLADNAVRYRPVLKDVNEMHTSGLSVRTWLEGALLLYGSDEPTSPTTPQTSLMVAQTTITTLTMPMIPMVAPCDETYDVYTIDDEELPECDLATEEDTDLLQVIEESDEYKKLVQFGQTINKIANVFGPDCLIEKADPTISLLDYVRSQRKPYTPVSLEPLPRKQCPHHVYSTNWKRMKCQGKTLEHGWCEQHAGSQLLLELGAKLGWPEANYSQHVFIAAGLVQWECFAQNANERDLRHALPFLKKMLDMENIR